MPPSAKEQRDRMIKEEMDSIMEAARDFCFEHFEEDMEDEAIQAVQTAARNLAYRKKYFDCIKDSIIYFPTCRKLILSKDLIEEAEKYYYEKEDEFPAEYSKALRTVVFNASCDTTQKTTEDPIDDEEFMEKLAMEWTEALD
mmetsp:Transcript_24641/g.43229  ORF Transcript_24641/g.43229 Transcript_24641/m.43229 type:complete len:142 (-) Transcript_24641:131-556(-)